VVEGEGKFLMPGLSDMHIHLIGSENDLLLYLANGITTIRDMGDGLRVYLEWRDQIDAGTRIGPNILVWSPMFTTMGRLDSMMNDLEWPGGKVRANNPEEMEKLVTGFADKGYDGIKSHVIYSSEVFGAISDAAKKHGLHFDCHVPIDLTHCDDNTSCWESFMSMEVEAVAHVEELVKIVDWSDESIRQAVQDVADDGLWVSTTIALMRSIEGQITDLEGELAKIPEAKYVNPEIYHGSWVIGNRFEGIEGYFDEKRQAGFSEYLTANEKMLMALHEAGAFLMSGTDTPTPLMVPGFSLHDELEYMVDLGFSPYEALRTSTYNPALYLDKLDVFGTVETGKRADLLLLDSNPLEDISNTRDISGVMVRGRWFTPTGLDKMLEEVASANKTGR
jgi:imidazolonepropionase-like amidohydrolase